MGYVSPTSMRSLPRLPDRVHHPPNILCTPSCSVLLRLCFVLAGLSQKVNDWPATQVEELAEDPGIKRPTEPTFDRWQQRILRLRPGEVCDSCQEEENPRNARLYLKECEVRLLKGSLHRRNRLPDDRVGLPETRDDQDQARCDDREAEEKITLACHDVRGGQPCRK
eukprot:CAMPEP_0180571034 /NCGR_PEP_ID=MMETSP1037_2-20121125/8506_1 /TAXON_ID=632150 /ORGANISM="Azadinium spinosum, Strain 3D9" /LENGTH=166 /DNA_ID=CAMNT_0022588329 /DNA_START=84 /DNA_END=584 /DNA_ORIENTATION=-